MILNAALNCNITLSDLDELTVGQLVDLFIEKCNAEDDEPIAGEATKEATQADFDRF